MFPLSREQQEMIATLACYTVVVLFSLSPISGVPKGPNVCLKEIRYLFPPSPHCSLLILVCAAAGCRRKSTKRSGSRSSAARRCGTGPNSPMSGKIGTCIQRRILDRCMLRMSASCCRTCYKTAVNRTVVYETAKESTCCPGYAEVSQACQRTYKHLRTYVAALRLFSPLLEHLSQ